MRALRSAESLIYLENQFLWSPEVVDLLADKLRRPPETARQVHRRRAQLLVDLWLEAGAKTILVGPNTHLRGPRGVVKPWPNPDNHRHVVMAKSG